MSNCCSIGAPRRFGCRSEVSRILALLLRTVQLNPFCAAALPTPEDPAGTALVLGRRPSVSMLPEYGEYAAEHSA
jgi:hypothetical protein